MMILYRKYVYIKMVYSIRNKTQTKHKSKEIIPKNYDEKKNTVKY